MEKPTMDRSKLHPNSNKAVAMDPNGRWLSYAHIPICNENSWQHAVPSQPCFRVSADDAPKWKGDWRESLIVFAD